VAKIMKTWLLLPAFNEEESLKLLLPRALVVPDMQVVVLDDGSQDKTALVVASFESVLLWQHRPNQGLGATLRDLLLGALELADPDDVLVTMDGDNTMDPALIPMMRDLVSDGIDIVIASRFSGGEEHGLSPLRRLLSRGASLLFRFAFPIAGVLDYTCGYRAYRVSFLRQLQRQYPRLFDAPNFTASTELLLRLAELQPQVREVPLKLRYDEKIGASKMRIMRTIREYVSLVWRLKQPKQIL
jgi:dolichol-phosphate mannosyltransferase